MKYPSTDRSARISEIFSSLQGEGLRVGEKHLFVRFEKCHIHCVYCDELEKVGKEMTIEEVVSELKRLEHQEGPHAFVSLTGGEPLLYTPFLKKLAPMLRDNGFSIYLETSGILSGSLEEIIDECDCIAMDMKLPSVTKERDFTREHEGFLQRALRKEVFVKIVVSHELDREEFVKSVDLIARNSSRIPLVLQPISAEIEGHDDSALMELLEVLKKEAEKKLNNVRIVKRLHKILNIA